MTHSSAGLASLNRGKMAKTQSEVFFENYCMNSGIPFTRVPEGNGKTPDYELTIDGLRIVVEVKKSS
jgi:hypothetical protein